MAFVIADRVRETTITTGTGTVTLIGAVTGYQSFAVIGNGNNTYYCIAGQGTSEWEVGIGTYTSAGSTLSRDTVLASSNSGSLVPFSGGAKDVFVTYPSERSVNYSPTGTLDIVGNTSVTGTLQVSGNTTLTGGTANGVAYLNGSKVVTSGTALTFNGTRLGVNVAAPNVTMEVSGTDAMLIPKGTTAQQPAGVAGYVRFNTTTSYPEFYNGTTWSTLASSSITNDTTTASNLYPLFAAATTGLASNLYTSNAKYLYKPSTGELSSSEIIASNGIFVNSATINDDYTIPTGSNAGSFGPVSVAAGKTVTVPSGYVWTIV